MGEQPTSRSSSSSSSSERTLLLPAAEPSSSSSSSSSLSQKQRGDLREESSFTTMTGTPTSRISNARYGIFSTTTTTTWWWWLTVVLLLAAAAVVAVVIPALGKSTTIFGGTTSTTTTTFIQLQQQQKVADQDSRRDAMILDDALIEIWDAVQLQSLRTFLNRTVVAVDAEDVAAAATTVAAERSSSSNNNNNDNNNAIWNETVHQMVVDDETILTQWWTATERVVGRTAVHDAQWVETAATKVWQTTAETAVRGSSAMTSATKNDWSDAATMERVWWNDTDAWVTTHWVRANDATMMTPSSSATVTYLNHSYAYSLLSSSSSSSISHGYFDYSNDYFSVRPDVQINQAYCGVASAAAVLNSFPPPSTGSRSRSDDPIYEPYRYITQTSLFDNNTITNNCVRHVGIIVNDTYNGILLPPFGLTLDMVASLLECQDSGITATVHKVDPATLSLTDLIRDLSTALLNTQQRVIVNYHRAVVGQVGGGHFSPLVGKSSHHDDKDVLFLIADVAKYKYPPGWVPAQRLYESMATLDLCGGRYNHTAAASIQTVPRTPHEFDKVMAKLQCQPTYRGYIIVEQKLL